VKDYLYETKSKNQKLDETNSLINETIDKYIDDDAYYDTFPILSKQEIKSDNPYFKKHDITVAKGLTSEEYKTISYLAPFYKEKVKYSVNNIERYLKFLGHKVDKQVCTIMCLHKDAPYYGDMDDCITFEEYLKLNYFDGFQVTIKSEFPKHETLNNEIVSEFKNQYLDGFDRYIDNIVMR
jgi:hypothetical protein